CSRSPVSAGTSSVLIIARAPGRPWSRSRLPSRMKSVMSRPRKRVWFGLLGRYLVFVTVLGLVATSVYAAVDANERLAVLRLAVAAFVTVILIHGYNHMRQQLEGAQPSAFDEARRRKPTEIKIAPMVVRMKESVQYGVASPRYFKESLWPRLVR